MTRKRKTAGGILIGIGGVGIVALAVFLLLNLLKLADMPTVGIIGGAGLPTLLLLIGANYLFWIFILGGIFLISLVLVFIGFCLVLKDMK